MSKTITCGVFLINKNRRILICHPTNNKPHTWSIPKGKLEENESMLEAAIRETYEETNIDLNDRSFFVVHRLNPVNYRHKKKILYPFLFVETIDSIIDWGSVEIKCNSRVSIERGGFLEMDEYKWVGIEDAKKVLHETQVKVLIEINEILDDRIYFTNINKQ
jgi:8-oxo-dGTP pyrophosphatase MutT (NUDIX family)